MGFNYPNDRARLKAEAEIREKLKQREDDKAILARKITMMFIDRTVNEIIRPGPVIEERECYEMSQELRDMQSSFEELALEIVDTFETFE